MSFKKREIKRTWIEITHSNNSIRMRLDFEKEDNGKWYVILPDWPNDHEELEMVDGADKLLDYLTMDDKLVSIDVYTEEPTIGEYMTYNLIDHDDYGGTYLCADPNASIPKIWLCNVMHFVFDGEHPETLYMRV